jgi:hypothetical protein
MLEGALSGRGEQKHSAQHLVTCFLFMEHCVKKKLLAYHLSCMLSKVFICWEMHVHLIVTTMEPNLTTF